MKIIFVRHGESEYNANPTKENEGKGLTKKGKEQAKYLGKKLREHNISMVYTSNLLRARQTGEIISKIIKVPIKENLEELNEFPSKALKSVIFRATNRRFRKLKKFFETISKEKTEDKTILIVSHGITNRIIMGYFLKMPLNKQLFSFWQHNTCVNRIYWDVKKWRIDRMNDIGHLPKNLIIE